jgi:uncharacterized damage-inducible protein DinB
MPTIQPEQAVFLLQNILPTLKYEHKTTRRIIEALPADKGDYRPDPIARPAFELAWHIAAAETNFLRAPLMGEFKPGAGRPDTIRNTTDVASWYVEIFEKNIGQLPDVPPGQLAKMLDFRGLFELPAVGFLDLGLRHTIHHRGQLSVYLRSMGAEVPAIYGESYDTSQARKAAQGL